MNWSVSNLPAPEVELKKIRLTTIPNFNIFGGCGKIIVFLFSHFVKEPWFIITNNDFLYSSKHGFKPKSYKSEAFIEFELSGIFLKGDVLVEFYNNSILNKKVNLFSIHKFKQK